MPDHQSLDTQIAEFIYNNNTCRHVVHPDTVNWSSVQHQRHNLNALFIAALMNCVTNKAHFLINQTSINHKLVFIATENVHDYQDDQSVTQAHLVKDYLTPMIANLAELDLTKTSCSYDQFSNTWTLTTDIPSI